MIYIFEDKAIVEEKTHDQNLFSISIGTLELFFSLDSKRLEFVQGYFPLDFVQRSKIVVPDAAMGNYTLALGDLTPQKGMVYNYFSRCPSSSRMFTLENTVFDPDSAVIMYGVDKEKYEKIRINSNLTIVVDGKEQLSCLYMHFDELH